MSTLSEQQAYDSYDEMLDELHTVKIGSLEYSASDVLKKMDPIAYSCGFSDFCDSQYIDLEEEED